MAWKSMPFFKGPSESSKAAISHSQMWEEEKQKNMQKTNIRRGGSERRTMSRCYLYLLLIWRVTVIMYKK